MDRHTPYSADDVDRQDQLDELNPFIPVPVLRASPPWRIPLAGNERDRASAHAGLTGLTVLPIEVRVESDVGAGTAPQAMVNEESRSRSGEAPMFSLDELLGMARDGVLTEDPAAAPSSSRNPPLRFRPNRPLRQGRETQEDLERTTSSRNSLQPSARENLIEYVHRLPEQHRVSLTDAGPPTALVGTLRRRRRIQMANTIIDAANADEIMPWDLEGGSASGSDDEHPWVVRSSRPQLYMHANPSGDNVDDWTRVDLRRGGDNRRRQSLLQRIRQRGVETVQMAPGVELRRRSVDINDQGPSEGLEPTNVDHSGTPVVVHSSGLRRARSEDGSDGAPAKKRRRKDSTSRQPIQHLEPLRPDYLRFSTLKMSKLFPLAFSQPTRDSHLALGSNKGRVVVTFITDPLPTGSDRDASALRTIHPIPVGCVVHYYEVTVIDLGEAGFMSVGWMKADTDLRRLIGWDKGSWGFHGDDGKIFEERGSGDSFAQEWNVGDVIGCGVDFSLGKAFFTRNGKMLGHGFKELGVGLHPAVAMRSPRETFEINLIGPFAFDIDAYVRCVRDRIRTEALGTDRHVSRVPRMVDQETLEPPDLAVKHVEVSADQKLAVEAIQVKEETMDVPGGAVPLDRSQLPSTSPFDDPSAATQAAFVLDHLAYSGHSRTHGLLKAEMARRHWLPSATSSHVTDITPKLQLIHSQITSLSESSPWSLLGELDSSQSVVSSSHHTLLRQLQIQDFIHLLWQSHIIRNGPKKGAAVEADRVEGQAIDVGRALLQRSTTEKWTTIESLLLKEAFGLLSLPPPEWRNVNVAIEEYRRLLANQVVQKLRRVLGLRQRSHLEFAGIQTGVVLDRLSEVDGCVGLMDVRMAMTGRYVGDEEGGVEGRRVENGNKEENKKTEKRDEEESKEGASVEQRLVTA